MEPGYPTRTPAGFGARSWRVSTSLHHRSTRDDGVPLMTFHLAPSGSPRFHIDGDHYDRYRPLGSWVTGEIGAQGTT